MNETSKCHGLRLARGDFTRFLRGSGLDVGAGGDALRVPEGEVRAWDTGDGDAQRLAGVPDETLDFVYSSHCLEHLWDVPEALANWLRVLKPGGHLYAVVPDYTLYEKLRWPSAYNSEHKASFSLDLPRAKVRRLNHYHISGDLFPLLRALEAEPLEAELEDAGYDYGRGPSCDQTLGRALAQIRIVARKTASTPAHVREFYGQHGEDAWVAENIRLPERGVFVEVGAGDGVLFSNTLHFEQKGWTGVLVEPDPRNHAALFARRKARIETCAVGRASERATFGMMPNPYHSGLLRDAEGMPIEVKTLQQILDDNGIDGPIDLLSIDTEGSELDVWGSFDRVRHRPRVVIIEWETVGLPAKADEINQALARDGYAVVHRNVGNLFLRPAELVNTVSFTGRSR